ncbi:hypothetical protein ACFVZZ_01225 [Streptomyces chartreusis]|uniref:hypothetical protein n=1 Tax=Streptomyces chartreusis TaxID=1969 RepID=UPI0036DEE4E9
MDWLSPLSGLVGALVGAAASYLGTHQAQARALIDARQARVEAKQDAAVLLLSDGFAQLRRHIRTVPEYTRRAMDEQDLQQLVAAEAAWDHQLHDLLGPVRIAAETMRDEKLRGRLEEVVSMLEQWEYELEYAYFQNQRTWILGGIVDHAVACVGAWQREDAMPEPNTAYRRAKQSVEVREEEWRLTREAQEEELRRQAQGDGNTDS